MTGCVSEWMNVVDDAGRAAIGFAIRDAFSKLDSSFLQIPKKELKVIDLAILQLQRNKE